MKTLKLFIIALVMICSGAMNAQVSVSVNVGSPPLWGPIGYTEVRYYYLPDVEAYYDVQTSMFIYYGGGVWIHRAYLPSIYGNYDLYGGYKVVMTDYYGTQPYIYFDTYKVKYKKGYRGPSQKTIGEKPGNGNNKSKNPSSGENNKKVHKDNQHHDGKTNDNSGNNKKTTKSGNGGNTGNGGDGNKAGGGNKGGNGGGGKKK